MNLDELDRLAAEKVMGWDMTQCTGYIPGKVHYGISVWHPTRNIQQAWECLEKAFGAANGNIFIRHNSGPANNDWICTLDTEYGRWDGDAFGSAPEAIVLACLKAVGYSPE